MAFSHESLWTRFFIVRFPLLLLVALTLSACSSVTQDALTSVQLALQKPEDVVLTNADIAALPYSAMYVKRPDRAQVLVVMGFADGEGAQQRLSWLSQGRQTIVTGHGRVIRTQGLDSDLLAISALADDPLRCYSRMTNFQVQANCANAWQLAYDIEDNDQQRSVSARAELTYDAQRAHHLAYGTNQVETRLLTEQVYDERGDPLGTNLYWLEADGHVLKSEQMVIPGAEVTTFTQVKWIWRD